MKVKGLKQPCEKGTIVAGFDRFSDNIIVGEYDAFIPSKYPHRIGKNKNLFTYVVELEGDETPEEIIEFINKWKIRKFKHHSMLIWEEMKNEFIHKIDELDNQIDYSIIEPEWWVQMMEVRRIIHKLKSFE